MDELIWDQTDRFTDTKAAAMAYQIVEEITLN